jgi:hypothetical protein
MRIDPAAGGEGRGCVSEDEAMALDPMLTPTAIGDLRPTQITVGFHEVAEKRKRWAKMPEDKRAPFLGRHMIPVILGPKGRAYVIDHHHLVRALHEEGCSEVLTTTVKDLSMLEKDAFWIFADNSGWCHPYDATGARLGFADIPKSIDDLTDDPYRSLAGAVRRAGGCAKVTTPFSEFMWADFLRRRLKRKAVDSDFSAAVVESLALAKSQDAKFLPGWCGPSPDD